MIDLGFTIVRSKGRGKKGEFVDVKAKLGVLMKKFCDKCEYQLGTNESCVDCKKSYKRAQRVARLDPRTINDKDENVMTSFFAMITEPDETYEGEKLVILNCLIQLGANPLTTIDNHKTCLHYAVELKREVRVVYIILIK